MNATESRTHFFELWLCVEFPKERANNASHLWVKGLTILVWRWWDEKGELMCAKEI